MLNMGAAEMILIAVVAMVLIPPAKLPGLATKLGRFIGQLKASLNEVRSSVETGLKSTESNPSSPAPKPTLESHKDSP